MRLLRLIGAGLFVVADLVRRDLIVATSFTATRAFGVEDYEPISDDPELNQPRSFPCTSLAARSSSRR